MCRGIVIAEVFDMKAGFIILAVSGVIFYLNLDRLAYMTW
jgi:hypothetical protein